MTTLATLQAVRPPIRPVRKTHGGKYYLRSQIIESLRPHDIYVETHGGGASVGINKPVIDVEVYNDLDPVNSNIFLCLKNQSEGLIDALRRTEYSETVFEDAKTNLEEAMRLFDSEMMASRIMNAGGSLPLAIQAIIVSRMSRGGTGRSFAWSERKRGGIPGDLNSWRTFLLSDLPRAVRRVRNWLIYNNRGNAIVDLYMLESTAMIYIDPPYDPKTRTVLKVYRREMPSMIADVDPQLQGKIDTHESLLKCVNSDSVRVGIAISGYDCELYREQLDKRGWRRAFEKEMPNHSGQGKSKERRTEILWTNY